MPASFSDQIVWSGSIPEVKENHRKTSTVLRVLDCRIAMLEAELAEVREAALQAVEEHNAAVFSAVAIERVEQAITEHVNTMHTNEVRS